MLGEHPMKMFQKKTFQEWCTNKKNAIHILVTLYSSLTLDNVNIYILIFINPLLILVNISKNLIVHISALTNVNKYNCPAEVFFNISLLTKVVC